MGDIDAVAQEANVMSELFDVFGMPLVVFVSTAAIAEDEEILIDYGQGYWEQRRRNLDYERQVARLQRAMERDWGSESATRLENVELREKLATVRTRTESVAATEAALEREAVSASEAAAAAEERVRRTNLRTKADVA